MGDVVAVMLTDPAGEAVRVPDPVMGMAVAVSVACAGAVPVNCQLRLSVLGKVYVTRMAVGVGVSSWVIEGTGAALKVTLTLVVSRGMEDSVGVGRPVMVLRLTVGVKNGTERVSRWSVAVLLAVLVTRSCDAVAVSAARLVGVGGTEAVGVRAALGVPPPVGMPVTSLEGEKEGEEERDRDPEDVPVDTARRDGVAVGAALGVRSGAAVSDLRSVAVAETSEVGCAEAGGVVVPVGLRVGLGGSVLEGVGFGEGVTVTLRVGEVGRGYEREDALVLVEVEGREQLLVGGGEKLADAGRVLDGDRGVLAVKERDTVAVAEAPAVSVGVGERVG